ncbi:hypothetical protein AAC387_Pa08g1447 [Persea americana]
MSFSDSISRQRDSSSTDSVDGDSFSTAAAFRLEGKKNRERSTNKWFGDESDTLPDLHSSSIRSERMFRSF